MTVKTYEWNIEAIIELPEGVDPNAFFDKAWDAVLDHVVEHDAHVFFANNKVAAYDDKEEEDDG